MPFLPDKMKNNRCEKLVCKFFDKKNYVIPIKALKLVLNCGLILQKLHKLIEFNQESSLKPYMDINIEHRMKASNNFENVFFKLMNNFVFLEGWLL